MAADTPQTIEAEGELAGTVRKHAGEQIRVRWADYAGRRLLDVQAFTVPVTHAVPPAPTKKGLTLRAVTWADLLPILQEALAEEQSGR